MRGTPAALALVMSLFVAPASSTILDEAEQKKLYPYSSFVRSIYQELEAIKRAEDLDEREIREIERDVAIFIGFHACGQKIVQGTKLDEFFQSIMISTPELRLGTRKNRAFLITVGRLSIRERMQRPEPTGYLCQWAREQAESWSR